MSRFRIVRRVNEWGAPIYRAQRKWLWWWIDCPTISCTGTEEYPGGAENPSRCLQLVQSYVEHVADNKVVYEYN
jgi:hypothetical protein